MNWALLHTDTEGCKVSGGRSLTTPNSVWANSEGRCCVRITQGEAPDKRTGNLGWSQQRKLGALGYHCHLSG